MLTIKAPAPSWRLLLLCAALGTTFPVAGHAAPPTAAATHRSGGTTLTIGRLPTGRTTMQQLAAYYYGAKQMSFVLQVANPWLADFATDRSLATRPGRAQHPTIRIPTLRGWRPIGPDDGAAR